MEPRLPVPQIGPEYRGQPQPAQAGETAHVVQPVEGAPGALIEQGKETHENFHDGPQGDPVAVQPAFSPPPLPVIDPVPHTVTTQQPQTATKDTPLTANDDDLIEREWVEKAKKIVAQTKNDPHVQEHAINQLQADYLQKRYGRTLKVSQEDS